MSLLHVFNDSGSDCVSVIVSELFLLVWGSTTSATSVWHLACDSKTWRWQMREGQMNTRTHLLVARSAVRSETGPSA